MPALGDFFRLRADAGFVGVWDPWIQQVIVTSRQVLGPRWEDCYLTAPVWRFCLPIGVAGPAAVMGVFMPSIDRVGRQFPLTLMTTLAGPVDHSPFQTLFAQAGPLDALEDLALDALDDAMTRDDLDARLLVIGPAAVKPMGQLARGPGGGLLIKGGRAGMLAADLATNLAATLTKSASTCVWCCTVDGLARLMTTTGLPHGSEALALFDSDAALWAEPVG